MSKKLSLLIIEDSESDMELVIRQFKKADYDTSHERVETADQMRSALEGQPWDLVIADYNLPEFDALSALIVLQKSGLDIPFIVVSGSIGEETAVALMKAGAHDCVMKDNLVRLIPAVNRELSEAQTRREKQKAEEQLKASEGRFRSIFDNVADGVLLTSIDGTILTANPAACRMLGRSEEEICQVGRAGVSDLSDPRFIAALEERKRTGKFKSEHFQIRKDGTRFLCEVSSDTFQDKDGCFRASTIFRDITERKRMEESIKNAAEEWRTTFDSIEDMVMIMDLDCRIVRVNKSVQSFLDLSYSDILGKHCYDLMHWRKQPPQECPCAKMLNTRKHEESETYIDEKGMWVATSVDPLFDGKGNITGAVHIMKDVTKRKRMEEDLRESKMKFQTLIESAPIAITWSDLAGNIEYCNRKFSELFGYTVADIPTIAEWRRLAYPDSAYRERVRSWVPTDKEASIDVSFTAAAESAITCKDGSTRYVVRKGSVVSNRFIAIFNDITEQKRAEEALRESEKKFRTLINVAPIAISWSDMAGNIEYCNHTFTELFGYTLEDIPTVTEWRRLAYQAEEAYHDPAQAEEAYMLYRRLHVPAEGAITCKDGSTRYVVRKGSVFSNRFLAIFNDITEQKRAEEALRENDRKLQTLMDAAPIGISFSDMEGNIEYANGKFSELFGYTVEDIPTVTEWRRLAYPDPAYREMLAPLVPTMIEAHKQGKTVAPVEVAVTCKDGSTRYVEQTGAMAYKRYLAIYSDLTERKRMEEALRDSESIFRDLVEKSFVGVYLIQDNVFKYVNARFAEIHGYAIEELVDKKGTLDTVVPEELSKVNDNIQKRLTGEGENSQYELRIITKQREIRNVAVYGTRTIYQGKPATIGTLVDITEQKRSEEALRESENKFRDLVEKSIVGVYLIQDDAYRYVNKWFAKIHGYTIEELVDKKSVRDLVLPEDMPKMRANVRNGLHGEVESFTTAFRIVTKQQEIRNVEVYGTYTTYRGKPAVIGTLVDITEQKRGEEALRESESKFRDLVEKSIVGVFLIQDQVFKYVNAWFAEIHGYAIEELVGKKGLLDMVSPEHKPIIIEELQKRLTGKLGSYYNEFRIITKQQETKIAEIHVTYTVYQGKPALIGTLVDVTERRRADEMLMDLFRDLEKKNVELENTYSELRESQQKIVQQEKMASIGQLAAGIAHEINNPVAFVMSNLHSMGKYSERLSQFIKIQTEAIERLSKGARDNAAVLDGLHKKRQALKIDYVTNDFINVIKESLEGAERVKRIVQDLKNFSRKDESVHKLADINDGIESTINVVWNELKYKADVKKEYGKIPLTKCSIGQLNQVFMNLLINAVHAIEEHGEILIKTERRDGDIMVSVSDTGCGIPKDKLNRIFEPFFTMKEVGEGTGLGLSIAYDIVKKHNGEILVTSEIGKGTTFTVKIPIVER